MRPPMSAEAVQRLVARLRLLVVMSTGLQLIFASQARANNASEWSCQNIPFADMVCSTVQATNKAVDFMSDPFGYIAQFVNNAVTSLFTEMINALLSTTTIDWTNGGFLRTYAMAFAASSVLTLILWLLAVAKRAFQGVPPMTAVGESIGFLLLSVVVTALAPAAIAYVTELFDEAAAAMFAPVAGDAGSMARTETTAMAALMAIPGGQVIVIFLALAMLSAVAGVWLELIVRDALILSGLVFGTSVFSGLVDRSMWSHVKTWVGVMGGIIASKYITLTTIALATGMLSLGGSGPPSVAQSFATVFTGIGMLWLALYLPFQLAKFLPIIGDDIQGMYQARDDVKNRAQNIGSQMGDTFGELKSRLGGGGERGEGGGEAEGSAESGSEMGAAGAGASATGLGAAAVAAKRGIDTLKDRPEQAPGRDVGAATGDEHTGGTGIEGPPDTPVGDAGVGSDGSGSQAPLEPLGSGWPGGGTGIERPPDTPVGDAGVGSDGSGSQAPPEPLGSGWPGG
jgi:hypothetical protein